MKIYFRNVTKNHATVKESKVLWAQSVRMECLDKKAHQEIPAMMVRSMHHSQWFLICAAHWSTVVKRSMYFNGKILWRLERHLFHHWFNSFHIDKYEYIRFIAVHWSQLNHAMNLFNELQPIIDFVLVFRSTRSSRRAWRSRRIWLERRKRI